MNEPRPSAGSDLALGVLMAGAALAGILWAAGAVSALASGHRAPVGHYLAGLGALAHMGDPSAAWGSPVGPAVLYWSLTGMAVLCAGLVSYVMVKFWRSSGTPNIKLDE